MGVLDGITEPRLAAFTGSHRSTIRRWFRRGAPRWLQRLAPLLARGELDVLDPAWRGWRLVRGELVSPEGITYTPGAVRASTLWRQRAIELGALDRRERIELAVNPVNRAGIAKLRALELALRAAREAMDQLQTSLTAHERNEIFRGSPAPEIAPRRRHWRRVAVSWR